MRSYVITTICGWFFVFCCWFCLWSIASYFLVDPSLAILFFPFALRLGLTLHTPTRYWLMIYSAEWCLVIILAYTISGLLWLPILIASVLSLPIIWFARRYYYGDQWRLLMIMASIILITALINTVVLMSYNLILHSVLSTVGLIFLVSITSGVILVPICYLLWDFLFNRSWIPLTVDLISRPFELKHRELLLYILLFVVNILLQINLPDELKRFAPFCLAIPIIVLAFRNGWQGALLGTLLNSIALIAVRSGVSNMEITDLLLSLLAQSLTGILLGIGIQRQRDLNQQLSLELIRNHSLSRQLIQTEESVRRDVAQELHDEIGQNITAIRTQASILKRVEQTPTIQGCASMIEQLSLNVYDTTKALLSRLRPNILDDLGLLKAIEQIVNDLKFEQRGIDVAILWDRKSNKLSDITNITLYRICQEALNNISKYAHSSEVIIELKIDEKIKLQITDNGIGFNVQQIEQGFGLRGISERVEALSGKCLINSQINDNRKDGFLDHNIVSGTTIDIILPLQ